MDTTTNLQSRPDFVFKHPFSMMIAAPSGGGKTCFVKKILENRSRWIHPPPQRIIWLYGQWQPLYQEMQSTIPGIEFVKGIPWNLDEDSFLDPEVRNLIVIDDLMTQATKDSKICDLFTKGSHHQNLSVICLLQNLYYHGKENRTMSLNSHYITLFRNARDEQQVMTLARQMYPGNSQRFIDVYKAATDKPYGYLVIDLKPGTSDADRFQPNVLESTSTLSIPDKVEPASTRRAPESVQESVPQADLTMAEANKILEVLQEMHESLKRNRPEERPGSNDDLGPPPGKRMKRMSSVESHQSEFEPATVKMPSCVDCGAYYATWEDLHRHKDRNCPVTMSKNEKKMKKMSPAAERELLLNCVKNDVNTDLKEAYNKRIGELVEEEGKSEKEALKRTYNEFVPKIRKSYRQALAKYFMQMQQIQDTELYKKIMQTAQNLMDTEEYNLEEAIPQAIKQRKFMFEQLVKENQDEGSASSESNNEESEAEEQTD